MKQKSIPITVPDPAELVAGISTVGGVAVKAISRFAEFLAPPAPTPQPAPAPVPQSQSQTNRELQFQLEKELSEIKFALAAAQAEVAWLNSLPETIAERHRQDGVASALQALDLMEHATEAMALGMGHISVFKGSYTNKLAQKRQMENWKEWGQVVQGQGQGQVNPDKEAMARTRTGAMAGAGTMKKP